MELVERFVETGFVVEDLFVVVRTNSPGVSRVVRQVHARKNHSYFLVFWKRAGADSRAWEPPMTAVALFVEVLKTKVKDDKWTGSALVDYRPARQHDAGRHRGRVRAAHTSPSSGSRRSRAGRGVAKTDLVIGARRFEVKTASEDTGGKFQFNHVRYDRQYDYLLCLGVRPDALMFALWSKGDVAESKAGTMVRMAEGQGVTFKLTKGQADMRPIEDLPAAIRAVQDGS